VISAGNAAWGDARPGQRELDGIAAPDRGKALHFPVFAKRRI